MLAVLRPALAVLLLVGAGLAAVDAATCCAAELTEGCALLVADDDDARVGGVAAAAPTPPGLTRTEQPPLRIEAPEPPPSGRTADVLATAPKTSPPA